MIKTLLQFEKKRKMISRQRMKIVIFNVKELKVVNPCGISFRGIGLHIIHDVEIFTALVFLRSLSNHKLWECACPYSLHRSAPREGSSMCKVRASEGPTNPNDVYPSLRQPCSRKSKSYFENRFILPHRRLVCSHAVISLRVRAAWAKPIKSVTHEVNLPNGFSLVRDTLSGLLAYFMSGFNENFVWSKKNGLSRLWKKNRSHL